MTIWSLTLVNSELVVCKRSYVNARMCVGTTVTHSSDSLTVKLVAGVVFAGGVYLDDVLLLPLYFLTRGTHLHASRINHVTACVLIC